MLNSHMFSEKIVKFSEQNYIYIFMYLANREIKKKKNRIVFLFFVFCLKKKNSDTAYKI